jgi:hypothetical protein
MVQVPPGKFFMETVKPPSVEIDPTATEGGGGGGGGLGLGAGAGVGLRVGFGRGLGVLAGALLGVLLGASDGLELGDGKSPGTTATDAWTRRSRSAWQDPLQQMNS